MISYDGDVAKDARTIFVSPPTASAIGAFQVEWMGAQIGYKGEIAILSATPTAANQNTWIKFMKATLKKPKYRNMKLVKVAYGNDNPTDSAKETQALLQALSEPEGDHLADDGRHLVGGAGARPGGKCNAVALTGLGLPNQMRKYVKKGCAKKFGLWNERDFGYLATYVAQPRARREADRQARPDVHGRPAGQAHGRDERRERARSSCSATRSSSRRRTSTSSTSRQAGGGRARGAPASRSGRRHDERRSGRTARWYVPDAYLPDRLVARRREPRVRCLLNTGERRAVVRLTFFFEDREPVGPVELDARPAADAARPAHRPEQRRGVELPRGVPFAYAAASDVPIVLQHSRLDTSSGAYTLATTIAYGE